MPPRLARAATTSSPRPLLGLARDGGPICVGHLLCLHASRSSGEAIPAPYREVFCVADHPRASQSRAQSHAARRAENRQNDAKSIFRLISAVNRSRVRENAYQHRVRRRAGLRARPSDRDGWDGDQKGAHVAPAREQPAPSLTRHLKRNPTGFAPGHLRARRSRSIRGMSKN